MNGRIDARSYVETATWIPKELLDFILKYSVAVNRLTTFFPEDELVGLLRKYQIRISHIVVAYEVPPGFTRSGQYAIGEGDPRVSNRDDTADLMVPGFYGLSREYDESVKIVLFMRENIEAILRDRKHSHVKGAYNQFVRLRNSLTPDEQRDLNPLSLVGVLPGRVISWGRNRLGEEYGELIEMAEATNRNSARFVVEALYRILSQYHFEEKNVIIIGSEGVLGKEIAQNFPLAHQYDIKKEGGDTIGTLLKKSSVILDCTNGDGLSHYLDAGYFQQGMRYVWIVESYPVPSVEILQRIQHQGLSLEVVHIKGVGTGPAGETRKEYGNLIPFPVYGHVMPCCTATVNEPADFVVTGELYRQTELG